MAPTKINFTELKKELKGIEKLSKDHLDIKSWASELELWMELQEVTEPRKIYLACILTSIGETRQIIQDLRNNNIDEEEDGDDEDDGNSSDFEEENSYPSFEDIIDALETFYGTKEDQNVLLKEIRALRIRKNEKVKDFNIKYRSLYIKLDKKRKRQVSVLDYADSLQNNHEAWKKVSLKDDISLQKAFKLAEKVDRLTFRTASNWNNKINVSGQGSQKYFIPNDFKRKEEIKSSRNMEKDNEMEDLTKKMRNLTIKVCFFCKEPGHYQNNCPKLRSIIDENRKEIYNQNKTPLN